jgi:hypothetical protein
MMTTHNTERLAELIGKKRHVLAQLRDVGQRQTDLINDRATCAQQAAECNTLLEEIVQLEKHGADMMTARRNEVAEQLQQAHAAAHVRSAYQAQR